MKKVVLILMALAWPTFASDKCDNAETTADMAQCGNAQLKKADAQLNAIYKKVMSEYSQKDEPMLERSQIKSKLLAAQKAWITYRDNDCQALYKKDEGGTIRSLTYLSCMIDKTEKRTAELKLYLE